MTSSSEEKWISTHMENIFPLTTFISYAPKDRELCNELVTHLAVLQRNEMITIWHNNQIIPGTDQFEEIDSHLNAALLILLLISPDFLASDYLYRFEMRHALERGQKGPARVVPILLRPVDWRTVPFAHLQYLPRNAIPITTWTNRDEAWCNVVGGIREVVEEMEHSSPQKRSRFITSLNQQNRAHVFKQGVPPIPFSPLLGREQEIASIETLLKQPEVRLLTLLGTGGVGKTRLCLQIATSMRDMFDEIYFVELASISDPQLLLPTIAQALGIQEAGWHSLEEKVQLAFSDKHLLLLLDNFEQVVKASPKLEGLLSAHLLLKIVVTSRERLSLQAEQVFPVSPLALPDRSVLTKLEILEHNPAVALFIQCARKQQPTFRLMQANADEIAKVCIRLDGLPLAIELAAARIGVLSPSDLFKRLSKPFNVLTNGSRSLPERQQTLHNTLAWSYNLLNTQEQKLFQLLSIFVGGWTLEAAETLWKEYNPQDNGTFSPLDGIASLLDKCLLSSPKWDSEEPRFNMLETVRKYGLECLQANRELEAAARHVHAAYFLQLAEAAEPQLIRTEQMQWLDQLEIEHGNLQAARDWLIASEEIEFALRFGAAIWQFWRRRGHLSEGYRFLERILAVSEGFESPTRVKAMIGAGVLAGELGDYGQAEVFCKESLELSHKHKDPRGIITSFRMLGLVAYHKGEYLVAREQMERALQVAQQEDDPWMMTNALDNLAFIAHDEGRYEDALTRGEECLKQSKRAGDTKEIRNALFSLAVSYFSANNPTRGIALLKEAYTLARAADDKRDLAWVLIFLGGMSTTCSLEEGDSGREQLEQGLIYARRVGEQEAIGWASYWRATDAFMQGNYSEAQALLEEDLPVIRQSESHRKMLLTRCLELLGVIVASQGELIWATRLWGVAETMRTSYGQGMPLRLRIIYNKFTTSVRTQLGEEVFKAALEEGQTMGLERALAMKGDVVDADT